ncbi:HNH endonuclease signature motif containing protein [Terrabacter terrigena]
MLETESLVDVLRSMADTLRDLTRDFPTWSLPEAEVGAVIGHAQQVRQLSQSLTAVLAAEADSRGLGADDGLSRTDWLRTHVDTGLDGPEAAAVTRVATAMNEPRWARLAERVCASEVPVAHAAAIVRFHDDVVRVADPDHLAAVVDSMVEACDVLDRRELARLISHARATLKPPAALESEEAGLRLGRSFRRVRSSAGFSVFELRLDPEGAAVVESAVDALSAPRPDLCLDGGAGEIDPRTPATRRADALLEIVGRGVAAPEGVTRSPRTTLVVTMSLDALLEKVRGAGLLDSDAALSPSAVRRLACEAGVVPMVLGARSEVLDLGHTRRLFSPAQRRALAVRDGGCSFPGCTVPPMWCDAHHVVHWLHGGCTDLTNGALLCGRHHTVVHRRGLTARVTATGVTWHV